MKDINRYFNQSCTDLVSADRAALKSIAGKDATLDETWVRVMHRRILRFSMLLAGTDPDDGNPLFHKLDPIPS